MELLVKRSDFLRRVFCRKVCRTTAFSYAGELGDGSSVESADEGIATICGLNGD